MKFRTYESKEIIRQDFDKDKITVTMCGQTVNQYDRIQAANIDTDIKEVLKKYHCTTDLALEIMQKRGGITGIYEDITQLQEKIQSLPDLIKFKDHVQTEFENLPLEMREKFGHNPESFLQNAQKYLSEKNKESNINNTGDKQNAN